VRLTGSPTVTGTIYERPVRRCSTCGRTWTAPAPDGVAEEKLDASADAATAIDKYPSISHVATTQPPSDRQVITPRPSA